MKHRTPSSTDVDILIVDDNIDGADAMAELVRLMGFSAAVTHTVHEALAAVIDAKPFCVLLDVNMPDVDGLDLARKMREKYQDDIVLIAITGAGVEDDRAAQTFDIVDHHLTKPINVSELERVLKG